MADIDTHLELDLSSNVYMKVVMQSLLDCMFLGKCAPLTPSNQPVGLKKSLKIALSSSRSRIWCFDAGVRGAFSVGSIRCAVVQPNCWAPRALIYESSVMEISN